MGQSCTKNFTVASIGLKPSNQRYGSQPNDSLNPYYPQTINYELAIIRQSQIKNYYLNTNYHKELVLRLSYEELAFLMKIFQWKSKEIREQVAKYSSTNPLRSSRMKLLTSTNSSINNGTNNLQSTSQQAQSSPSPVLIWKRLAITIQGLYDLFPCIQPENIAHYGHLLLEEFPLSNFQPSAIQSLELFISQFHISYIMLCQMFSISDFFYKKEYYQIIPLPSLIKDQEIVFSDFAVFFSSLLYGGKEDLLTLLFLLFAQSYDEITQYTSPLDNHIGSPNSNHSKHSLLSKFQDSNFYRTSIRGIMTSTTTPNNNNNTDTQNHTTATDATTIQDELMSPIKSPSSPLPQTNNNNNNGLLINITKDDSMANLTSESRKRSQSEPVTPHNGSFKASTVPGSSLPFTNSTKQEGVLFTHMALTKVNAYKMILFLLILLQQCKELSQYNIQLLLKYHTFTLELEEIIYDLLSNSNDPSNEDTLYGIHYLFPSQTNIPLHTSWMNIKLSYSQFMNLGQSEYLDAAEINGIDSMLLRIIQLLHRLPYIYLQLLLQPFVTNLIGNPYHLGNEFVQYYQHNAQQKALQQACKIYQQGIHSQEHERFVLQQVHEMFVLDSKWWERWCQCMGVVPSYCKDIPGFSPLVLDLKANHTSGFSRYDIFNPMKLSSEAILELQALHPMPTLQLLRLSTLFANPNATMEAFEHLQFLSSPNLTPFQPSSTPSDSQSYVLVPYQLGKLLYLEYAESLASLSPDTFRRILSFQNHVFPHDLLASTSRSTFAKSISLFVHNFQMKIQPEIMISPLRIPIFVTNRFGLPTLNPVYTLSNELESTPSISMASSSTTSNHSKKIGLINFFHPKYLSLTIEEWIRFLCHEIYGIYAPALPFQSTASSDSDRIRLWVLKKISPSPKDKDSKGSAFRSPKTIAYTSELHWDLFTATKADYKQYCAGNLWPSPLDYTQNSGNKDNFQFEIKGIMLEFRSIEETWPTDRILNNYLIHFINPNEYSEDGSNNSPPMTPIATTNLSLQTDSMKSNTSPPKTEVLWQHKKPSQDPFAVPPDDEKDDNPEKDPYELSDDEDEEECVGESAIQVKSISKDEGIEIQTIDNKKKKIYQILKVGMKVDVFDIRTSFWQEGEIMNIQRILPEEAIQSQSRDIIAKVQLLQSPSVQFVEVSLSSAYLLIHGTLSNKDNWSLLPPLTIEDQIDVQVYQSMLDVHDENLIRIFQTIFPYIDPAGLHFTGPSTKDSPPHGFSGGDSLNITISHENNSSENNSISQNTAPSPKPTASHRGSRSSIVPIDIEALSLSASNQSQSLSINTTNLPLNIGPPSNTSNINSDSFLTIGKLGLNLSLENLHNIYWYLECFPVTFRLFYELYYSYQAIQCQYFNQCDGLFAKSPFLGSPVYGYYLIPEKVTDNGAQNTSFHQIIRDKSQYPGLLDGSNSLISSIQPSIMSTPRVQPKASTPNNTSTNNKTLSFFKDWEKALHSKNGPQRSSGEHSPIQYKLTVRPASFSTNPSGIAAANAAALTQNGTNNTVVESVDSPTPNAGNKRALVQSLPVVPTANGNTAPSGPRVVSLPPLSKSSLSSANNSQRNKNTSNASMTMSIPRVGIFGFNNLGNTCFLSSALQCLVRTPIFIPYFLTYQYKFDINTRSKLGSQGRLTEEFAKFVQLVYKLNSTPISSTLSVMGQSTSSLASTMKRSLFGGGAVSSGASQASGSVFSGTKNSQTISNQTQITPTTNLLVAPPQLALSPTELLKVFQTHKTQFSGADQQDAQEFLMELLDTFHEDLKLPPPSTPAINQALAMVSSSLSQLLPFTPSNPAISNPPNTVTTQSSLLLSKQLSSSKKTGNILTTTRSPSLQGGSLIASTSQDTLHPPLTNNHVFVTPEKESSTSGNLPPSPTSPSIPDLITDAKTAWSTYLSCNHSVVANIFQGQLCSHIACETCGHSTTSYEPFTTLSLSLPSLRANSQSSFLNNVSPTNISVVITCYRRIPRLSILLNVLQSLLTSNISDKLVSLDFIILLIQHIRKPIKLFLTFPKTTTIEQIKFHVLQILNDEYRQLKVPKPKEPKKSDVKEKETPSITVEADELVNLEDMQSPQPHKGSSENKEEVDKETNEEEEEEEVLWEWPAWQPQHITVMDMGKDDRYHVRKILENKDVLASLLDDPINSNENLELLVLENNKDISYIGTLSGNKLTALNRVPVATIDPTSSRYQSIVQKDALEILKSLLNGYTDSFEYDHISLLHTMGFYKSLYPSQVLTNDIDLRFAASPSLEGNSSKPSESSKRESNERSNSMKRVSPRESPPSASNSSSVGDNSKRWPKAIYEFSLNDRVDALDHKGQWYAGSIVEILRVPSPSEPASKSSSTPTTGSSKRAGPPLTSSQRQSSNRTSPSTNNPPNMINETYMGHKYYLRIHFDGFSTFWDEWYDNTDFQKGYIQSIYTKTVRKLKIFDIQIIQRRVFYRMANNLLVERVDLIEHPYVIQIESFRSIGHLYMHIFEQIIARFLPENMLTHCFQAIARGEIDQLPFQIRLLSTQNLYNVPNLLPEPPTIVSQEKSKERFTYHKSWEGKEFPTQGYDRPVCNLYHPKLIFSIDWEFVSINNTPAIPFLPDNLSKKIFEEWKNAHPGPTIKALEHDSYQTYAQQTLQNQGIQSPTPSSMNFSTMSSSESIASSSQDLRGYRKQWYNNDVRHGLTIENVLGKYMAREEIDFYCEHCQSNQRAAIITSISHLPDVLILHLKRLVINSTGGMKIRTLVKFPFVDLDMTPYTTQEMLSQLAAEKNSESNNKTTNNNTTNNAHNNSHGFAKEIKLTDPSTASAASSASSSRDDCMYDLYGVVNHLGGMFGGHYTAYAECEDIQLMSNPNSTNPTAPSSSTSFGNNLMFNQQLSQEFFAQSPFDSSITMQDYLSYANLPLPPGNNPPTSTSSIPAGSTPISPNNINNMNNMNNKKWYKFDDEYVIEMSGTQFPLESTIVSESAYLLFYKRRHLSKENIIRYL